MDCSKENIKTLFPISVQEIHLLEVGMLSKNIFASIDERTKLGYPKRDGAKCVRSIINKSVHITDFIKTFL